MARKFASLRRLALSSQGGAAASLAALAASVPLSSAARTVGAGGTSTGTEMIGGLGALLGGGIGMAFGQPFLGSAIGGALFNPIGQFIAGQQTLQAQMLALSGQGFMPGMAQQIGMGINPAGGYGWLPSMMRGIEGFTGIGMPWTGRIGAAGGGDVLQSLSPFLAGGLSPATIGGMASTLTQLYGIPGATDIGQAQSVFGNNPVFAQAFGALSNPSADYRTLARMAFGNSSAGYTEGMVLAGGGPAAVRALAPYPELQRQAQATYGLLQADDFMVTGAQARSSIAGSSLSVTRSEGAAPGSSDMRGAFAQAIDAVREFATALRTKAGDITGDNAYSRQARADLMSQASAADATAASLGYQQRNEIGAYQMAVAGTNVALASGAFARERMGLPTGAVAASLGPLGAAYQSDIGTATALAGQTIDPFRRLAYLQQADADRTAVLGLRREGVAEQYAGPAQAAILGANQQMAAASQAAGFGMGEDRLGGLYTGALSALGGATSRQTALIRAMQQSGVYSGPEIDQQKAALAQMGLQENAIGRLLAYNGSNSVLANATEGMSVAGARAGFLGLLGGGSLADVGIAGGLAGAMDTLSGALGDRSALAARLGDTRYASQLSAQSATLGYQAEATRAAVYAGGYRPSAASTVALGNADLAEQLAANDIGTGGFVPTGLRRARMSTMAQQLGAIDAYVAGAPANMRDQAAAGSMGLRNSLVLAMQQEQNALQFGEIGHLINVGVGTPGNFSLRAANIGDWQRLNPGGTRALGGTGAALDASPFSGMMGGSMSAGSLAQALGGSSGGTGVIEDLLRQLIAAVQQNGTGGSGGSVGTFGMRDLTKDPREQARQNSPVR